jgi:hypothetical protein
MTLESSVQGNRINSLFNRAADRASDIAERSKKLLTKPVYSLSDGVDHELAGLGIVPFFLLVKTVQGLASLSASITGGRRMVPSVESKRPRF